MIHKNLLETSKFSEPSAKRISINTKDLKCLMQKLQEEPN